MVTTAATQPIFTFVHATDPHWGLTDEQIRHAPRRTACFVADVQQLEPPPAFVVISGDIVNDGTKTANQLALAAAELAAFPVPVSYVPGNHDLHPHPPKIGEGPDAQRGEWPPLEATNWHRQFGDAGMFWVRRHGPLELIGFGLRNGDPDGILDKLTAHLQTPPPPRHPWRILVGHYPIYHVRTAGTLGSWGQEDIADCVPRLQQLLRNNAHHVVAYFFGHVHALAARVHDGVLHATGGGIAFGAPGFRLYDVYESKLVSRFVPLSDGELNLYNFWGLHNENAAVDADHPTPTVYHQGLPLEQHFTFDFATRLLTP